MNKDELRQFDIGYYKLFYILFTIKIIYIHINLLISKILSIISVPLYSSPDTIINFACTCNLKFISAIDTFILK